MLSEQQSIDEFFRKKEEGFAPAPGREDTHWQQMKTMLPAPGSATPGKTKREIIRRRIIGYSGGFIIITIITTIIILSLGRSGKKASVATARTGTYKNTAATKQPASPSLTTTATKQLSRSPLATITATKPAAITINQHKKHDPHTIYSTTAKPVAPLVLHSKPVAFKTAGQPVAANVPRKTWQQSVTSDTVTTVIPVKNSPDAAELLGRFYSQLQPPPQEFLIRTEWDTTLVAKEGTRVFIPSHAFVSKTGKPISGAVKIVVEEFYNYDKMIAAGLSTMSGGEQLVSGGMLHIVALVDGHELLLQPSVSLKVKMPTNNYDGRMQLFTGSILSKTMARGRSFTGVAQVRSPTEGDTAAASPAATPGRQFIDAAQVSFHTEGDTAAASPTGTPGDKEINWMAIGQWQQTYKRPGIKVLDLRNNPAFYWEPQSGKLWNHSSGAVFLLHRRPGTNKEEVKKELEKRYGYYYDKIKVRYVSPLLQRGRSRGNLTGDSISLSFDEAIKNKLLSPADSLAYINKVTADSIAYFTQAARPKEYTFNISNLGWFNCDRFSKDPSSKVEFVIDPGPGVNASLFRSQLIFTRYKSIMPGHYRGNKLSYGKIPVGEPLKLVCVGVKDGKVVSCIAALTATAEEINNLRFEETTPEQFNQKLKSLNLQ